jgi:hypothetical protein
MKHTTIQINYFLLISAFILFGPISTAKVFGQNKDTLATKVNKDSLPVKPARESLFNLLTKTEIPKFILETDLTTMMSSRKTNAYFTGTLTSEDGVVRKVEIKTRGKYRRKTCEIPPLKLKFSKKGLVAEGLDTLNEIKLLMPCYDNDRGDELVMKEYLAYRMFEKLTPASVRARLIKINLKDTHVEKAKKTFFALLVEDEEELAARLKAHPVDQYGIDPDSLNTQQAALTVMFNYMIGNTDWEIAMMRNVRLMQSFDGGKPFTVPYDFDFSGFVAAPYSSPSSESGLKTVRDRFLMASGVKSEALKRATKTLREARPQLLEICKFKPLDRDIQNELIAYLQIFFDQCDENTDIPTIMKMPPTD